MTVREFAQGVGSLNPRAFSPGWIGSLGAAGDEVPWLHHQRTASSQAGSSSKARRRQRHDILRAGRR